MIKAIIFDWHGVLDKRTFSGMLETIAEAWYPLFAPTKRERKETSLAEYKELIKQNWQKDGFAYAAGRISPEVFWSTLECEEEYGVETAKQYLLAVERNEPLWQLLRKLKEKYKLAVLSDCPPDKAKIIRETTDISYFDAVYFSCDYNLLKSDQQFFEIATNALNTAPDQCLFVDDSETNLFSAKGAGLQTCLYRTTADLEKKLASFR